MSKKDKKTLLFSPACYNLAETSRCIEIAKACRPHYEIIFMSAGGQFEALIKEAGFNLEAINPRFTAQKIAHIYKIDQAEKLGHLFSRSEIEQYMLAEIKVIEKYRPAAIITGFDFIVNLAGPMTCTPVIWLSHSTWNLAEVVRSGLGSYPDIFDTFLLKLLPSSVKNWLGIKMVKIIGKIVNKPFNQVCRKYRLKPFHTIEEQWQGDYNLLAEPEDFSGMQGTPGHHHFIGPLLAKINKPVPPQLLSMDRDKPLIYFAMGSSGKVREIKKIIEGFKEQPFNVIAPLRSKIKDCQVNIPDNVLVVDWVPALEVSQMADLSVIHGGIGTVMTAALAGKPVVGIGMMYEQEYNLDCLVRKGFAVRLRRKNFTTRQLNHTVLALLSNQEAREKAQEYQKKINSWYNYDRIQDFFLKNF